MIKSVNNNRIIRITILAIIMALAIVFAGSVGVHAASLSVSTATAKVDSEDGAYLRAKASTTSNQVKLLKDNAKLVIKKEVFDTKGEVGATHRWYYVTAGKKTGYIRADLVDTIKYSTKKGQTTTNVNFRKGPDTTMEVAGGLQKGTKVTVVLKANLKGKSTVWYKIKKDSKYYYICGKYIKAVSKTTKKTTTKKSSSSGVPTFTQDGVCYPISLSEGAPFSLSGTVGCDKKMASVRVGAVDSSGSWVSGVNKSVTLNSKTFNIKTADADIKFAKLAVGSYTYRLTAEVDGKTYRVFDKSFTVKKTSGATLLANTAIALAWGENATASDYTYVVNSDYLGSTPAYQTALAAAYPNRSSWKYAASRVGASCDVFIGTVCVYSGYDKSMPHALTSQWKSGFDDTSKWTKVNSGNSVLSESELRNGDIILYLSKDKSSGHIFMYVKKSGTGYIVEANFSKTKAKSAHTIKSFGSRLTSNSSSHYYYDVYRAAK